MQMGCFKGNKGFQISIPPFFLVLVVLWRFFFVSFAWFFMEF